MTYEVWSGLNAGAWGCSWMSPSPLPPLPHFPSQSSALRFLLDQTVAISTTNEFLHFPSALGEAGLCRFNENILFVSKWEDNLQGSMSQSDFGAQAARAAIIQSFLPNSQPTDMWIMKNNKLAAKLWIGQKKRKKATKKPQNLGTVMWCRWDF